MINIPSSRTRNQRQVRSSVSENHTDLEYGAYTIDSTFYSLSNGPITRRKETYSAVNKLSIVTRSSSSNRLSACVQKCSPTTLSDTNSRTYQSSKHSSTPMVESPTTDAYTTKEVEKTSQTNDIPPPPAPLWPRAFLLFVAVVFGTNFPMVKFLQLDLVP